MLLNHSGTVTTEWTRFPDTHFDQATEVCGHFHNLGLGTFRGLAWPSPSHLDRFQLNVSTTVDDTDACKLGIVQR